LLLDSKEVAIERDGLAARFLAFRPSRPKRRIGFQSAAGGGAHLRLEDAELKGYLFLQALRNPALQGRFVDAWRRTIRVVAGHDKSLVSRTRGPNCLKSSDAQPDVVAFDLDI
jgi:hypothetical protein